MNLGFIRQYLGEVPPDRTFTAKELWEVFNAFAPLMTKEQEKKMVDNLKNLLETHTVKEEKLGCGCVKNTCKCDPMRHWPPVCCDKCPSLPKEEPTTPEKKRCKYCGTDYTDPKYCSVFGRSADEHKWL